MFRNLCGEENFKNVVVLTTFWDSVSNKEGEEREEQIKLKFFKDLFDGGAHFMRHNRTIESARNVLGHILTLVPTNVQIQEEIRLEGKRLEDTAAGSVQREEVERMIAKHKAEVEELRVELVAMKTSDAAARRELEEERSKLQAVLARWETEKSDLKRGMDHERERRERIERQATIQTENYEKRERERDASLQTLRAQLDREKKLCEEEEKRTREKEMDSPPPYEEVDAVKVLPLRYALPSDALKLH
jgi:hypothetical protein